MVSIFSTIISQPLAFYLIRLPIHSWLVGLLGKESGLFQFLTTLYAPITEEPAKFLPALLIPVLYKTINEKNVVAFGLALGLGFGMGEIWFIAYQTTLNPEWTNLPFYNFLGFAGERAIVCFLHGAFTATALKFLDKRFWLGAICAMTLHYFLNFPIFLSVKNVGNLGATTWAILLNVWIQVYFFSMIGLMARFHFGAFGKTGELLFGKAKCPECAEIYSRPLFGLNFGSRRYERCPHCRKFHLLSATNYVGSETD